MPIVGTHHRQRAQFQRDMAAASVTNMARLIHIKLAESHGALADARPMTRKP